MALKITFGLKKRSSYLQADIGDSIEDTDFFIKVNAQHPHYDLDLLHEFCHILVHRVLVETKRLPRYLEIFRNKSLWRASGVPRIVKQVEKCAWLLAKNMYTGSMDRFRYYVRECLTTYQVPDHELDEVFSWDIPQENQWINYYLSRK